MLNRASSHIWGRWYFPTFLLRMDYWLLCIQPLLSLSWGSGPPFPLYWNFPVKWYDLWCYNGHILGREFQVIIEPLPKSSWFFNILLITFHSVTFVSIHDTTCFGYVIFIFRCHWKVFDGFTSLQVQLYPMFSAYSFDAFTWAFCIGTTM